MTRPPALVATDLDGTIVPSDGEITQRTVDVLQRLERDGVPVVFVTGRPARWMAGIAERTGHTGIAVCANGALLYDMHTDEVVATYPMAVEVGLDVARRLRAALPDIAFAVETAEGFAHEATYRPRYDVGQARAVDDIERIYGSPAIKLLARHEALHPDELLAAAREVAGDLAELTHSSSTALLEISAPGISKATTLARLCEERGIEAADVVAFGDMPNDLAMLAWAGRPYAVRTAHPDVLAAVEGRVDPPEQDGVARELELLFGL